jgi:hypothetical protein
VSPLNLSLSIGDSQQLTATGTYSNGSTQNLTTSVVWSSANNLVATVSAMGLATMEAGGSTTITATSGSISGKTTLQVSAKLESISVTPQTASIPLGTSQQFKATGAYSDGSKQDLTASVTWSSSNQAVATINSSGLAASVGGGSATIMASMSSLSARANVNVAYQGVLTYRNDSARTGQDLNEATLTLANVNSVRFGRLLSYPVDGAIYAQPLYVASVRMPGQVLGKNIHNVVYVVTEHDSVYAFDADGKASAPLWHVSFTNASATSVPASDVSDDTFPGGEIGITSTPAIDPVGGTIYVVAYTAENGGYVYRLHALDLISGAEKFGGPVLIQASVPGTGDESNGQGQVPFDPKTHLQRPGLLLVNGVVYIGFGSHTDTPPWHGWLLAYNATTLHQVASFNTTPNGSDGALWGSGGAPAADANGNIYVATGNGTFDVSAGGLDYGDSVLKLNPGTLTVLDWFSPFNTDYLAASDADLGSGGTMLLPDQPGPHPHLSVVAGKEGRIYLIDRDNLGHFNSVSDQIVQELTGVINNNNLTTPAYWQGNIYYASQQDNLKMFTLSNGLLSTGPVAFSPETFGYAGASPSISANGLSNGILWAVDTSALPAGAAVLRAYDATDVSHELYNSTQAGTRDTLGPAVKFTVPTVVNGKVYVGTGTELDVFGPLPP